MGGGSSTPLAGIGGTPSQATGPFQNRDQFGRVGPFAGRDASGMYLGGRMNYLHPQQQQGPFPGRDQNGMYPNQQNLFTGGTPLQNTPLFSGGTPMAGSGGTPGQYGGYNDFGSMLNQLLGGSGNGGGYGIFNMQ